MSVCPVCFSTYVAGETFCPEDAAKLQEGAAGGLRWGDLICRKYQLLYVLARGGMSTVWLSNHILLKEKRVLKILLNELHKAPGTPDLAAALEAEARLVRKLQHPGIVQILDVDRLGDGRPFIVMEFIAAESLKRVLQREGKLHPNRALEIAAQTCAALQYAHAAGVIHRDIKPDNILLEKTREGTERVRIIDFGIAKIRDSANLAITGLLAVPTGMFAGTPLYASPEQIAHVSRDSVDGGTDIYSTGLVLYEALVGALPKRGPDGALSGESREQLMHVSAPLRSLIERSLDPRRDCRQTSAAAMLAEIDSIRKEAHAPRTALTPPGGDRQSQLRARPGKRVAIVAALAGTTVSAGGAWWLTSRPAANGTSSSANVPAASESSAPAGQAAAETAAKDPRPVVRADDARVNSIDGLRYRWIPPGRFQMGCSPGDNDCDLSVKEELPTREVEITKGFWMGETEVTQEAYRRVTGLAPSYFKGPRRPVEKVSWEDARQYCLAAGMRLPTDAEWEYAARAGTSTVRYGPIDDIAWYKSNSATATHNVGGKAPNAWGLYDTLGNVWEWVADWYDPSYDRHADLRDPIGPASGRFHVLRGGSFDFRPQIIRVSYRVWNKPTVLVYDFGFRCAGELP